MIEMRLQEILFQFLLTGVLLAAIATAAAAQAKHNCREHCGDVGISYPFGLDSGDCSLGKEFLITCNDFDNSPIPFLWNSTIKVTRISIDGQLEVWNHVSQDCYSKKGGSESITTAKFRISEFSISNAQNKFTAIGCDTYAYIQGYRGNNRYSAGCMSICERRDDVVDGSCSGSGCCQIEIPVGLENITVKAYSFNSHINTTDFNLCSYAFIVDQSQFVFSSDYLANNISEDTEFPMMLDWTIGKETCKEAKTNMSSYACMQKAGRYEPKNIPGYRCRCLDGYKGNPYLSDSNGCQDFDECVDQNHNNCAHKCVNTEGNYTCTCPNWYHGDGIRDGQGCIPDYFLIIKVSVAVGISFIVLLVCTSWLYLVFKRRKLIKLKEKFFQKNGGLVLQQQLSTRDGSSDTIRIFSAEELEKATNNYDEGSIIGQGGYGTVYKGVLTDEKVIAIKKSKLVEQSQIEQFINEVVVLSQINHRNVVKLLGCCLETEVPLLVYEYVNNGTLFDHIHNEGEAAAIPWETRLKIAAEIAGVLFYLHSSASTPIIHRDVKSTNILLDDKYVAKVSDFGASRLVPVDQTELTTMVQGTLGYLDPEYLHTSQLTEKSDVYSFGVVLVELLTGKKALCFDRPEEERSLARYFVSSVENNLFDLLENHIMDEGNINQLKEFAVLAKRCLKLRGDDRPTMKEVAMELEGLLIVGKHPWVDNVKLISEETEHLLDYETGYSCGGCSSNSTGGYQYDSMRNHVILSVDDG